MEILLVKERYGDIEAAEIHARIDGVIVGTLEYSVNPDNPYRVSLGTIQVIDSRWQNKGVATSLVRGFVKEVGAGRQVDAEICNDETYENLSRMGIFEFASMRPETFLVGNAEIFKGSPVLRALGRGGVDISSLTIENRALLPGFSGMNFTNFTPDEERYRLVFKGVTRARI